MMMVFVCCMAPAWFFGLQYYLGSTYVIRNIRYGKKPRNFLDICLPQTVTPPSAAATTPSSGDAKRPVVIFVTGGM